MIAEQKTAQMRVIGRGIIAEGSAGQIFWATPTRARLLIDIRAAELVNQFTAPVIGPSETKPMEPAEKKHSAISQGGRLTDSVPSIESGTDSASSVLVEAHRSPKRSVPPLKKRGRPPKSKSWSSSTFPRNPGRNSESPTSAKRRSPRESPLVRRGAFHFPFPQPLLRDWSSRCFGGNTLY